jgi:hypothetical protein
MRACPSLSQSTKSPRSFVEPVALVLSDEEIWQTVNRVCEQLPPGKVQPEDLEELIAALAERIQRRSDGVT